MIESGNIKPAFESSISVVRSIRRIVRLVPDYQAAVLSYQLVLKLAEILDAKLRKEVLTSLFCAPASLFSCNSLYSFCSSQSSGEELETLKQRLLPELHGVQQNISDWRDELLQKPLMMPTKSLTYPKEIEVNSGAEYSVSLLPLLQSSG